MGKNKAPAPTLPRIRYMCSDLACKDEFPRDPRPHTADFFCNILNTPGTCCHDVSSQAILQQHEHECI